MRRIQKMILLNENAAVALLHNNNHRLISVIEHNRQRQQEQLCLVNDVIGDRVTNINVHFSHKPRQDSEILGDGQVFVNLKQTDPMRA